MNSGIILINKEKDWTSRDVDNKVRSTFHIKKVGHAGTLDPFATGLLIVAVDKATKIIPYLEDFKKTYVAEISLGEERDTGDCTGKTIATCIVPSINKKQINDVLMSFMGEIEQLPPMYSAVKIKGKALYAYAREGQEIERKKRKAIIYSMKLISFDKNIIKYEAVVSKGTYIRTLSEEIAKSLNTLGYTLSLVRTKIGDFSLSNAKSVASILKDDIIEMSECLDNLKVIVVKGTEETKANNGQPLVLDSAEKLVLVRSETKLIAIYELRQDGIYYSKRGLQ